MLGLSGLGDFDLSEHRALDVGFAHDGVRLSGTLYSPGQAPALAAVLLVHGDGPQDRLSGGAYQPLINTLLDHRIAVYTWDKPGIGHSGGNWLDQTMEDRAQEAAAAGVRVRSLPDMAGLPLGTLGFSQAGWVLPKLARQAHAADFHVLIGAALNWQSQGAYYSRTRMERAGHEPQEIARALADQAARNKRMAQPGYSYQAYLSGLPKGSAIMSEDRFGFVVRNMGADATKDLESVVTPLLIMHGGEDLNIDPHANQRQYSAILRARGAPADAPADILMIEKATHGLLKAPLFNYQLAEEMPVWKQGLFVLSGRTAYAEGALSALTGWILDQAAAKH